MTLQLLEEGRKQAWASSALLDYVGCSTKLFGRQNLAETGRGLFFQNSDIWTDQATRELQPEHTAKYKHKTN